MSGGAVDSEGLIEGDAPVLGIIERMAVIDNHHAGRAAISACAAMIAGTGFTSVSANNKPASNTIPQVSRKLVP